MNANKQNHAYNKQDKTIGYIEFQFIHYVFITSMFPLINLGKSVSRVWVKDSICLVFSKILSSIGFATISNSETISSEGTMISML